MKTGEFLTTIHELNSSRSRNYKRDRLSFDIKEYDEPGVAMGFLCGDILEPDTNLGVGRKTVSSGVERAFTIDSTTISDRYSEYGSLTEAVANIERPNTLTDSRREMEISEIHDRILEICATSGETDKIKMISETLSNAENPSAFVFCLLSEKKDLAIGVSWKTVRDATAMVGEVSEEALNKSYGVGYEVKDIVNRVSRGDGAKTDLSPTRAVRPMLASSGEVEDDSLWVAQTKYDGGRLLIHQSDGEIRAYTRDRHEISANLPELNSIDWPDADFIVDSEAIGKDSDGNVVAFQKFMERFQREKDVAEKAKDVEIEFKLFDVLHYNKSIVDSPYHERHIKLEDEFPEDNVVGTDIDLEHAYTQALDNGHEGIIAKRRDHTYEFQRSNNWIKTKPVKEPIELVVVDAIEGTGRMNETLGSLVVSTKDGVPVGRVGTGFSDEKRDELWDMHDVDNLIGWVVEIEYEELQERDGDYGLRFPRFKRLRPNGEADTIERIASQ